MSRILYILDDNKTSDYKYNIEEDMTIYHFSINSSSEVNIYLNKPDIIVHYYYNNINYDNHSFHISIHHLATHTHSEVINHGVNVGNNKLTYQVDGIVPANSSQCICNQENQIINMKDGKSTILPNLLIDNYDVDSNHAAYIGKFKDEFLFYMMSRGISKSKAYRLLLNGFLLPSDSMEPSKVDKFIQEIEKI